MWKPSFDVETFRTIMQTWIRLYGIPLEFRKEQNLWNLAVVVGLPLKIDPVNISMYNGLYARVLVDVDISKRHPERILASLKNDSKDINVNFFL